MFVNIQLRIKLKRYEFAQYFITKLHFHWEIRESQDELITTSSFLSYECCHPLPVRFLNA